jgi:hypothetical protein
MSRQTGAALPLCATRWTHVWHPKQESRRQAHRASLSATKEKCSELYINCDQAE